MSSCFVVTGRTLPHWLTFCNSQSLRHTYCLIAPSNLLHFSSDRCNTDTMTASQHTTQPALPLDREAELTIRHIRNITSGLRATGDTFVQSQARALDNLADALERSLTK